MRPSDQKLKQGPISIISKDPTKLDEIHDWVHDRKYNPTDVRYRASEHILEVPFLCTVYEVTRLRWGVPLLFGCWWIPVVRGYLRFHNVREYSVRDDGPGQLAEISVTPNGRDFCVSGISEISGVTDAFEVSVELRDQVIGWVRMLWVFPIESEGNMQSYNQLVDDLNQA